MNTFVSPSGVLASEDKLVRFNPLYDSSYQVGFILVAISALLFTVPLLPFLEFDRDNHFFLFCLHYGLTLVYAIHLKVKDRFRLNEGDFKENIGCVLIWLVLSLISCYALNREIPVFMEAAPWFATYVVLTCFSLLAFSFREMLSSRWQMLLNILVGASLSLLVYLSLYLLPISGYGVVGGILLGVGFHAFVPMVGIIILFGIFSDAYSNNRKSWLQLLAGLSIPVVIMGCLLGFWNHRLQQFTRVYNQTTLDAEGQLPDWVYISQRISNDWVTERLLKTQLVYETPQFDGDFFRSFGGSSSFSEKRQHDPLVMIATLLFGPIPLDREQKIRVLEAMYDSRHQAQERLWSGTDLRTANVATNVRLFPASRLAYTEQTLNIRNTLTSRWDNQQEAIYTFHLPEGAAVTSLSLWINGKEEKAYLTTKGKAEKAYKTIVGVEAQDPSVVHWQEGNQVSVRVFPCTNLEDRRVKIGITSPLRLVKDQLIYSSIHFDGPSPIGASESVRIQSEAGSADLDLPSAFFRSGKGIYSREGDYWSDWELRIPAAAPANQSFSFGGKTYLSEPYEPLLRPFAATTYFLDINASWTSKEKEGVWEQLKDKKVYVFDQGLVRLTEQNREEYFDRLGELRYTLFPVYEIRETATSLLITKSSPQSPNLRDLKQSAFSEKLLTYLKGKPQLSIYNLSSELSPYLQTLKQFRVLEYDEGELEKLTGLLERRQFVYTPEDDQAVVIGNSGLRIRQTETAAIGQAPDHLLRVFAYNQILRNIGPDYFSTDFVNDELVRVAEQANVVSPVSSLIVLESQADYERFDITKSKDSLGNASAQSSGAVPEPHEWMLIGLVLVVGAYLLAKTYG
jgi:XrtN system VIT domain protein